MMGSIKISREKKKITAINGSKTALTYVGVAECVLRVRQSARAALRQPVNVQAAEDEQQADQVLAQRLHFLQTWLTSSRALMN